MTGSGNSLRNFFNTLAIHVALYSVRSTGPVASLNFCLRSATLSAGGVEQYRTYRSIVVFAFARFSSSWVQLMTFKRQTHLFNILYYNNTCKQVQI